MRISTNTIFDSNVAALNQQQARLLQTQQQIASGRKLLTASDDPVAATRALAVSQSDATNTQYASNRNMARNTLSMAETTLQSVTSLLQDVRDAALSAGNGLLTDDNRSAMALDLKGRLQELIGLANSTDGIGNYLFSGFQSRTQPFAVDAAAGATYAGDDGQRNIQVSASRQMASSDSGSDVFMRVKNGNGAFVTQSAVANTGTGIVSVGNVVNTALLTDHDYSITFTSATTYDVTDTTTATPVSSGNAYVSGQAISFDGMQFEIKGAPAIGDTFTVTPSVNENIFKTVSDLIGALNTPVAGANLSNSLLHSVNQLDNALNNVLNTRVTLGLRLNEVDALDTAGEDLGLQFKKTLSELQDTDYNKAISDLSQQQMSLQAAQQSFVKVTGLSLFNYI